MPKTIIKKKENYFILCTLFILNIISVQTLAQQSAITIKTTKEGISFSYKDAKRLSGGIPLLENDKLTPGNPVASENSYTFGTADKFISVVIKKSAHDRSL